jgi:renalase
MPPRAPVVVVGAGIAGLACARALTDGGLPVTVLERGRRVGGRMASRRVGGTVADLGAQYVTAEEPELEALLRRLAATGQAEPWATRLHQAERGRISGGGASETGRVRWAFPDGMATPAERLALGLPVRLATRATGLGRAGRAWQVRTADGELTARAVVLALPAPEALPLLGGDSGLAGLAAAAGRAAYDPCWALAAGYPDAPPPTWRGLFVRGREALAWVAHDSSKRRDPPATVLVAHATGDWTRAHQRADPELVTTELVTALARVAGRWAGKPAWTTHQLWPHAQLRHGTDEPWLLADGRAPVGCCGDWCAGPKVEGAWRSGHRLAAALLDRLV